MEHPTLILPLILTDYNTPWKRILPRGTLVSFPVKRLITGKNDTAEHGMYYIKSGCIRLSNIALNGQERMLLYMGQGTLFSEIPMFLATEDYLFTSMEETEAVFLPKKKFTEDFIRENPELIQNLLESLSKKSQHFFQQLCNLQMFTTFGNLCRSLYSMHLYQRRNDKIVPRLAIQELAAYLGVHRSSLHKGLKRLKAEGVIGEYSRSNLKIYDIPRLALYCAEGGR